MSGYSRYLFSRREVRLWRDQLHMTQADLARRVGVTRAQVGEWETGMRPILPQYQQPLADAFLSAKWETVHANKTFAEKMDMLHERTDARTAHEAHGSRLGRAHARHKPTGTRPRRTRPHRLDASNNGATRYEIESAVEALAHAVYATANRACDLYSAMLDVQRMMRARFPAGMVAAYLEALRADFDMLTDHALDEGARADRAARIIGETEPDPRLRAILADVRRGVW